MCNSLADGGLRCLSHVQEDIQKLTESYQKGLAEELSSSDVSKDENYINRKMQEYKQNNPTPEDPAKFVAELKEDLLAAHSKAMASKKELSEGGSEPFVSIADDLSDIKDSIASLGNKSSTEALAKLAEDRKRELNERPDFATFKDKDELVNTVHLIAKYNEEIGQATSQLWKKVDNANNDKESELVASNPILKKLRQKAKVSEFFNTENSYSNEKIYNEALNEEKRRVGFEPVTKASFAQESAYIDKLNQERDQLKGKLQSMKKEYQENAQRLADKKLIPHAYFLDRIDSEIESHPTKATFKELVHNENVYQFKRLKEKYISASSSLQNPTDEKEKYRAKVTSEAPYDKKAVETFKNEVYNKKPKTIKILQSLEEKTAQKHISPGYRKQLQNQINSNQRDVGDMEEDARLRALKKKYDTLAEIEIGKNRLKSLT